jgi:NAD(P)-dependent dehydrogenase (short-subunit alcohol dehydrogenase family)
MKLKDKVAIITGGSKGIGLGCAKSFGKYGCRVIMAARGEEDGQAAAKELCDAGSEATFVRCEVTSQSDPANALWRCQASPNRCRVGEASRVLLVRASG